ncbi:M15 family metallopeptidase [Sphingomonas sp. Mn802worker]|uniref:M15 family metallopeptidase n=1 Tax=Sphingomonas sp. Mn802worker TaxID=629773 RepID=UPI000476201B|nr:M15 family metallopeptidase [Sphingomonas sp. Mn802worker]
MRSATARARRLVLATAVMVIALPASAEVCNGAPPAIAGDGRVLGHLPYGDAPPDELVAVPADLAVRGCAVRRDVLPDLERLLHAAAIDPAVGGRILALSCHRTLTRQGGVFCREPSTEAGTRAVSVAPPGHSEHATGYALDFAFRPRVNDCPDAEACIAATPAFRWLRANAPRYGFEMSFPVSNAQGVKWEPWHWRWVGTSAGEPGAARARALFATARRRFPASPGIDTAIEVANVTPPPTYLSLPPFTDARAKRRRRR